jgi:toxin ParE1/3/4
MPKFRLAETARQDLIDIAQYGDERFGIRQSDRYRDQLKQRFQLLAARPLFYPAVDHIRTGYRRSVCGVHSIYYRIDGDAVEIMRILGRQDPAQNIPNDTNH